VHRPASCECVQRFPNNLGVSLFEQQHQHFMFDVLPGQLLAKTLLHFDRHWFDNQICSYQSVNRGDHGKAHSGSHHVQSALTQTEQQAHQSKQCAQHAESRRETSHSMKDTQASPLLFQVVGYLPLQSPVQLFLVAAVHNKLGPQVEIRILNSFDVHFRLAYAASAVAGCHLQEDLLIISQGGSALSEQRR